MPALARNLPDEPARLSTPLSRTIVSPAMLRAGRKAFALNRANLSDLWEFFPDDRDSFITEIYAAMAAAAPRIAR